jgi:hypothetical protein
MYRSTKATREKNEKERIASVAQNIINPKERLLNFKKRNKLKDLLITKFRNKYGINENDQVLETEVTKFLQGEKLTDIDLQRLDNRIKTLFEYKKNKQHLKTTLTHSLLTNNGNLNKSQPDLLPQIQAPSNCNLDSTINQNLNQNSLSQRNDPKKKEQKKLRPSASMEMIRTKKNYYKSPEEELAELEAEFAEEEKERLSKRNFKRIDFSGCGDEWLAMAKYNKKMYEKQLKEEREKDAEIKRRTKEDLDNQIKQKLKREYEGVLREKEEEKIFQDH